MWSTVAKHIRFFFKSIQLLTVVMDWVSTFVLIEFHLSTSFSKLSSASFLLSFSHGESGGWAVSSLNDSLAELHYPFAFYHFVHLCSV